MPDNGSNRAYDVALSFAGEDRPYVERVAAALQEQGVRVFYDKYEEVSLWGQNLYTRLQIVYSQQAEFTVMFVSKAYAAKLWTNREREYAQERTLEGRGEYILPARFDDTEIPGLLKTTAYVDLREKTPEDLANLILQKLQSAGIWKCSSSIIADEAAADVTFSAPLAPTPQPVRWVSLTRTQIAATIAIILMLLGVGAVSVRYFRTSRQNHKTIDSIRNRFTFVVAVAPFYGPDAESTREGRLMAAIVERAVAKRLSSNARVIGIEETVSPIRSAVDAHRLGLRLGADAVIWGEAFAVHGEAEIEPHVSVINTPDDVARPVERITGEWAQFAGASLLEDKSQWFQDDASPVVKLSAASPDQIELRRTSITRIADLLLVIAGIDAMENRNTPKHALALFEQVPESPDLLRMRVQALVRLKENDRARVLLERLVAMDSSDARSYALLGDLHLMQGREAAATLDYRRAAESGRTYTSTRGIFYDGRLYLTETYQTPNYDLGKSFQTLFLLAMDTTTHKIIERHSMPGLPRSFHVEDGALVIGLDTSVGQSRSISEMRLRDGKFDKPLWPGPNLGRRMYTDRGCRLLASNFLEDIERRGDAGEPPRRFALRARIDPHFPSRLPDLERALRTAIQHDPTQPWHRFLLALTLREMKRFAEADAMLDELVRREDPGVPYYHFSWMLTFAIRVDEQRWVDRLWLKIKRQRKFIPQPPEVTTILERLINAQFIRAAAMNTQALDNYPSLRRARELTGITIEAEDLVAAVWVRHFNSIGDRPNAEREGAVLQRAQANPQNNLAAAARSDHALTAVVAANVAFFGLVLMVLANAYGRVLGNSEQHPSLLQRLFRAIRAIESLRPVARATVGTLLFVFAAVAVAWLVIPFTVVVALHLLRVSPRRMLASITRRECRGIAVAYLLVVFASVWLLDTLLVARVVFALPFGVADGIGHPRVIQQVEDELRRRGGTDTALLYAAALANHYGGNRTRAAELYASLPQTYSSTVANLLALTRGQPPAVALRSEELFHAFADTRLSRWRRFADLGDFDGTVATALAWTLGALFSSTFMIAVLFAFRRAESADVPPTTARTIAALLLPGLEHVRQGRVWWALTMLVMVGISVLPLIFFSKYGTLLPSHGLFTSTALPNFHSAYPLPGEWTSAMWATMVLAYPNGWLFSGIVIGALTGAVILHLWHAIAILRAGRAHT